MGYLVPPEGEIWGDFDETLTPNLVGSIFHTESDMHTLKKHRAERGEV